LIGGIWEKRTSSLSHQVEDSKRIARKPHHDLTSGQKNIRKKNRREPYLAPFWLSPYFLQHPEGEPQNQWHL
jgi:hypothetical protein